MMDSYKTHELRSNASSCPAQSHHQLQSSQPRVTRNGVTGRAPSPTLLCPGQREKLLKDNLHQSRTVDYLETGKRWMRESLSSQPLRSLYWQLQLSAVQVESKSPTAEDVRCPDSEEDTLQGDTSHEAANSLANIPKIVPSL